MKPKLKNDDEIVADIKKGGKARTLAIRQLYYQMEDVNRQVIRFVKNNSGNEQDGQDIFHEGIITLDKNIRQGKFRGESALGGYLYSICRFLWMNQIRKKARVDLTDDHMVMDQPETENPEVIQMSEEKSQLLGQILGKLGERCRKILELWKLSYSMQEIADRLGFSSAAMATKNKYQCHKALVNFLQEHPHLTELLKA